MKTFNYVVAIFLLLPLGTVNCVSREYSGLTNNSELQEIADSSLQESALKQGYHKTYYPNGVIKEELYYKDGKLHGYIKEYDEQGFLKEGRQYDNGVLNGVLRQYSKGVLITESIYEDGKLVRSIPTTQNIESPATSEKTEETVDLSTTEFKYVTYFLKLKRQVESEWKYPKESRYKGEQGTLHLIFTLDSNGNLLKIKLTESSGHYLLDDEAERALRAAAPYAPFPEHWGDLQKLNIRASFTYGYGNTGL